MLDKRKEIVYSYELEDDEAYFMTPHGRLHEMYFDYYYSTLEERNYGDS